MPPPAKATERSIAVLPLANAGNDAQQLYFSDGLSENLIDALSRFGGLKVIGRTSAFRFRDSKDDSATIGRKLGVSYLLTGSVQRADDVVRINAALTRAADGSTLWAEHYDRPYKDLFALQDEIASAVASALHAKLLATDAATKPGDRPPSGNIEAYNAYLQGLKHGHDQDFRQAAEYMTRAVQLDPGYAAAWAYLSGSWSTVATFSNEDPAAAREHMREARLAADKALQLAPGLGQAHAARAHLQFYNFNHRDALAECRRAVQLAPDDGSVLNGCGFTLAGIGKLGEAIRLRERLLSIEPLYNVNYHHYATLLMATGQLDKAAKYLRIAVGLSSPTAPPPYLPMYIAIARGDLATAQDVARNQPPPWREMDLAIAAQLSPDRAAADAALAKALADEAWTRTSPYAVAQAYALRGDADKTVEWLERAPVPDILFLLTDPIILHLRDDPRLIAFCEKTGLPPPSASEALSIDQIRAIDSARSR
ncbi:tetratricopeptide repeat protein [Rhodanobacter lindaniclasticus]